MRCSRRSIFQTCGQILTANREEFDLRLDPSLCKNCKGSGKMALSVDPISGVETWTYCIVCPFGRQLLEESSQRISGEYKMV